MTISPFVASVIVFAAALWRQVGVPKVATMWAEDGRIFLQCVYDQGAVGCVGQAYQGYLHLSPRVIAAIAGSLPPDLASAAFGILAGLVAAAAAFVAGRAIAGATASPLAGLLGAIGLGLVWQAGREVLGNSANLHWVLFAASSIAIVSSWLGARISRGTLALVLVTGLTSAFAPLVALLAVGSVIARRPRARLLLALAGGTAIIQVLVELTSQRVTGTGPAITLRAIARFFRTEVFERGFYGPGSPLANVLVPLAAVAAIIAIGWLIADRRIVVKAVVGATALVGTGVLLCAASIILNNDLNPRYAYLPATMIVAALALSAGYLSEGLGSGSARMQRAAPFLMPVIVIVVGAAFLASFRLQARASLGPDLPAEIDAIGSASCPGGGSVSVAISPTATRTHWFLKIPCDRLGGTESP